MIEQQANIITSEDGKTWLQVERQSTCSQCSAKKTCGAGMLSEHVGKRFSRIAMVSDQQFHQGQTVTVSIPERSLITGALQVYLVPLLCMLVLAIVARMMAANGLVEAIAGITGLGIGLFLIKKITNDKKLLSQIKVTEDLQ